MSSADDSLNVPHPRYGTKPRITGENPQTDFGGDVCLHWHSPPEVRVPNTAIAADVDAQVPATVPVTHYYDVRRRCLDCGRPFLFFAAEQKFWYETLGFPLEADCVRCVPCRKQQQGLARTKQRYEELCAVADPTVEERLEFAECAVILLEGGVLGSRVGERARSLLNRVEREAGAVVQARVDGLRARLTELDERTS